MHSIFFKKKRYEAYIEEIESSGFYFVSWEKTKVWFIAQLVKQKETLHAAGGHTLENSAHNTHKVKS